MWPLSFILPSGRSIEAMSDAPTYEGGSLYRLHQRDPQNLDLRVAADGRARDASLGEAQHRYNRLLNAWARRFGKDRYL